MIDAASSPPWPALPDAALEAGVLDARAAETGEIEAGTIDARATEASTDARATEAGSTDARATDAEPWDATSRDAGEIEAGPNDAGSTAPHADASAGSRDSSTPISDAGTDAASGEADATLAAHVVHVDSKAEWTPSDFRVQAGKCYAMQAKIDDRWLDLDVEANLEGWVDQSDLRIPLFALFRRVPQKDIGFYQFASCVDRKLDQCFPIGASSTVCPRISGELFFFVNDVPGFESNNVGTATVTIRAK